LSPNDQVAVEVFGEDDLRANGRLNGEGNLSVPLLGSIHLAGLTLTQAASKLTGLYARVINESKVNVMLAGYAKRRFSVLGRKTIRQKECRMGVPVVSTRWANAMAEVHIAAEESRRHKPRHTSFSKSTRSGSHGERREVSRCRATQSPLERFFKSFSAAFRASCSRVNSVPEKIL
jgi:hypothetical protein